MTLKRSLLFFQCSSREKKKKIVIKKQSDTFHLNLILNIPPSPTNSFSMKPVEREGDRFGNTHSLQGSKAEDNKL